MLPNGFIRVPEDQLGGNWMKRQLPWVFPVKKIELQPMPLGPPHPSPHIDRLKQALMKPS